MYSLLTLFKDGHMPSKVYTHTGVMRRRDEAMHKGSYFVFGNLTQDLEPLRLSDITLFALKPHKGDCYKFGGFGCSSCLNLQISQSAAHNEGSLLFVCSLISHSLTLR